MEAPLIPPPSERRGKVMVREQEVLYWPEDGVQLHVEGPGIPPRRRDPALDEKYEGDGNVGLKVTPKAGGAIRVGDRIVRLPHKSENPRAARRHRKLPGHRALLPYDARRASAEVWDACARGRGSAADRFPGESTLSVLSYQVLSSDRASEITYIREDMLHATARRQRLLEEVLCYAADVICLQDVDCFGEFWQPNLNKRGYDMIFSARATKTRPRSAQCEGVLVAWNRDLFTLFRSEVSHDGKLEVYKK